MKQSTNYIKPINRLSYYTIKPTKGKLLWHNVLLGKNGEIIMSSENYFSKSNAVRAAKKTAKLGNFIYERP